MASTINGTSTGNGGLVTTGDDSGILQLQTNETTAVTIDASQDVTVANDLFVTGNVGIGTSSPAQKLDVRGSENTVQARFGNISGRGLTIGTAVVSGTNEAGAVFDAPVTGGTLIFQTQSAERARIDSSGNLLVGTTNGGTANANTMQYLVSNAQGYVTHASGVSSGTGYWVFSYGGTAIGSIYQNGTTAVAYSTTSDYRLKENVQPIANALDRVAALKPCTYTWKSAPNEIGEGFLAHELAEVCSQAVVGEKDAVDADGNPKYQGIDTSFLVATLTAAIQEQQALITTLTERITALEGATQ